MRKNQDSKLTEKPNITHKINRVNAYKITPMRSKGHTHANTHTNIDIYRHVYTAPYTLVQAHTYLFNLILIYTYIHIYNIYINNARPKYCQYVAKMPVSWAAQRIAMTEIGFVGVNTKSFHCMELEIPDQTPISSIHSKSIQVPIIPRRLHFFSLSLSACIRVRQNIVGDTRIFGCVDVF